MVAIFARLVPHTKTSVNKRIGLLARVALVTEPRLVASTMLTRPLVGSSGMQERAVLPSWGLSERVSGASGVGSRFSWDVF